MAVFYGGGGPTIVVYGAPDMREQEKRNPMTKPTAQAQKKKHPDGKTTKRTDSTIAPPQQNQRLLERTFDACPARGKMP